MPLKPAPTVHALLRVAHLHALVWEERRPRWAARALARAPWTVMRRAPPQRELWPVGVRGRLRSQRSAAWLPQAAIQACVTPQMLAATRAWREHRGAERRPAIAVLDEVADIFAAHGFGGRWGPAGSVGFELASGMPSTTAHSDLDLVLIADLRVARTAAAGLHADLATLRVRIDLLLETPRGAVALAEYANSDAATLLRSPHGPRLVRDPWSAAEAGAGGS